MQRGHELRVGGVEIANLAFEVTDQLEGGKAHDEVLHAPLAVLFGHLVSAVGHLGVDVAAQLHQVLHQRQELILELQEFLEGFLFCFSFEVGA